MTLQRADVDVAATAMKVLAEIRGTSENQIVSGQILTRLARLPAQLRTSGPLPTLAFHAAKGKGDKPLGRAYAIVGAALRAETCAVLDWPEDEADQAVDLAFLTRLTGKVQEDPVVLIQVTLRLQEFSVWLRRLAEALDGEQERSAKKRQDQREDARADD
ncbi:type III-B CRISPR module-associated protein Cmr5 [Actinomadura sp. NPDC023710]|uniref:type III-B CRISPR module-associated protein Cmr5 n=1 Tax=Actinomadura sp. NPDC023710 TaxID=3158219 RepID=UPI0033E1E648